MEKNNKPADKSRLGRGLASLIPPSAKSPVAAPPPPPMAAPPSSPPRQPGEMVFLSPPPPPAEAEAGVSQIPLDKIVANTYQPRSEFDEAALHELTESVLVHGVLQPVMVRPRGGGRYELIAGERRFRAAQQAGLREIPAVVREMTDEESLTVALIENIQREDLNAMEAARGYKQLLDQFGMTQAELARQIGKSPSTIAYALSLLKLSPEMQESISSGKLSMEHGKVLLSVASSERRFSLWQAMLTEGLSMVESRRRAAEEPAASTRPRPTKGAATRGAETKASTDFLEEDVDTRQTADRLRSALGMKVVIRNRPGGGGEVTITYANWDEMETIIDHITGSSGG